MRTVVIGSVTSTLITLEKLLEYDFEVICIVGYKPLKPESVSGYVDLEAVSDKYNIPFIPYTNINDQAILEFVAGQQPDIIFAVGFSQLLKRNWFLIPRYGIIGFHPTQLPRGRGRAPMAWLILNQEDGAATFFEMNEHADAGGIFVQIPFNVKPDDDVESIRIKLLNSMRLALDEWLPQLKIGIWNPKAQDEEKATYFGVRKEVDGFIDWSWSAEKINRLVKATTRPYPGAFTVIDRTKIIIWKSSLEYNYNIMGVVARILKVEKNNRFLVQCGEGLLWIDEYESVGDPFVPKVGEKLGLDLYKIYKEIILNQIK